MIELKHIYKSFGDTEIIKDISMTFEKGKTNLIIGQSGAGKTVLLKCVVGIHDVTKGEVIYDNRVYSAMNLLEKKMIRREIGMVFQGGALFDSSTVLENVMFPLMMFSEKSKEEQLKRARFCLDRVNLSKRVENLYPSETSGGMQKRIAIARAIVLNPEYLFFDEPNSGLDPKTGIVIDKLIKEITVDFNTVTIINTHDMNSIAEIGDKIAFIYKGQNWWTGDRDKIYDTDNQELNDFIFATELMRALRDKHSAQKLSV